MRVPNSLLRGLSAVSNLTRSTTRNITQQLHWVYLNECFNHLTIFIHIIMCFAAAFKYTRPQGYKPFYAKLNCS